MLCVDFPPFPSFEFITLYHNFDSNFNVPFHSSILFVFLNYLLISPSILQINWQNLLEFKVQAPWKPPSSSCERPTTKWEHVHVLLIVLTHQADLSCIILDHYSISTSVLSFLSIILILIWNTVRTHVIKHSVEPKYVKNYLFKILWFIPSFQAFPGMVRCHGTHSGRIIRGKNYDEFDHLKFDYQYGSNWVPDIILPLNYSYNLSVFGFTSFSSLIPHIFSNFLLIYLFSFFECFRFLGHWLCF